MECEIIGKQNCVWIDTVHYKEGGSRKRGQRRRAKGRERGEEGEGEGEGENVVDARG